MNDILTAAKEYTAKGWVVHPLSNPTDKTKTAGKRPLLAGWQTLTQTPTDIEKYISQGCNIGLVCGKASDITIIDMDSELFRDELFIGFELDTLVSRRTTGRGHIYFKYNPNLSAQKHHDLGIEILSDGSNAVLSPSIHKSGDVYKWDNPDAPIIDMPKELERRLLRLFQIEAELKQMLSKCRHCFHDVIKRKPNTHGAEGREYMIVVCADLKAKGATEDHAKMFSKLMYQHEYDEKRTLQEWNNIDPSKTWQCDTLKAKLPAYIDSNECDKCDERRQKSKNKQEGIAQTSFLLLPEGKIAEEVYNGNGAKFALWNGKDVEYVEDFRNGRTYKPLVNDAITTGAVKLPSIVQDYGTPQELIDAIQSHIHKYLDVSRDMEVFATWYVLLSWLYDRVNTLPYLRALGDTGCGKSRFLDVIGGLCYKACMVSGAITPAPIYRMIRQWGGTIVMDEADFRESNEKNEVITILNCGFEKNRPVIRCDQNNVDTLQFLPTYCPKVIATRYSFDDKALESRCLTEKMTQTDRKDIPRVLPTKFYEEQQELRNMLLMFRFRHYHLINGDAGQGLDFGDIEPRLQQATQSFAALFSKVPELMERFKTFLEQYNRELIEERSESFDGMIVQALIRLHGEGRQDISSKDIANKMIEDFWLEKVTSQSVGKHLKSLKVETERKGSNNKRTVKWDEKLIEKLKARYLPKGNSKDEHEDKPEGGDSELKPTIPPSPPIPSNIVGESREMDAESNPHAIRQVAISPQANGGNDGNGVHSDFKNESISTDKIPAQKDRMHSLRELWESLKDQPTPKEVWIAFHARRCQIPEDIAKSDIEHFLKDKGLPQSISEPVQPIEQTTLELEDSKPEDKEAIKEKLKDSDMLTKLRNLHPSFLQESKAGRLNPKSAAEAYKEGRIKEAIREHFIWVWGEYAKDKEEVDFAINVMQSSGELLSNCG